MTNFNEGDHIAPPTLSQTYAIRQIDDIISNSDRAMNLGIEKVGDYFAPTMAGQLCSVIAQTSNYKSGFMRTIARYNSDQLLAQGRDEIIIYVSVEESIEEMAFHDIARQTGISAGKIARGDFAGGDWKIIKGQLISTDITGKIWRIGNSIQHPEQMQHLTMSNMIRTIKFLVEGGYNGKKMTPATIYFDYLQAFPFDAEIKRDFKLNQRRLQVREDVYRLRQAASYFQCPVWVGVQAKQNLNGTRGQDQTPGIYDGEESSAIAQRSDRIIQLWLPKMNYSTNSSVTIGGEEYLVSDDLLILKVGKQRGGLPSGKTFVCSVNYEKYDISCKG